MKLWIHRYFVRRTQVGRFLWNITGKACRWNSQIAHSFQFQHMLVFAIRLSHFFADRYTCRKTLKFVVGTNLSNVKFAGNYLLKVSNRSTRTRCEIYSKLTVKTLERRRISIVNFEHISHLVLVFLLLTWNM